MEARVKRQLAEVEATAEAAAAAAQKRLKEYVSKARLAEAECEALRTRLKEEETERLKREAEVAALGGDAEVNKLRTQHDYLRKMLKESHSVLTKVLAKEGALKDELSLMKRGNERLNGTNLLYLKNVVVSFLIKIYGDADDEEHIRLAQVLQTVLHFSPEEVNQVNDKIDYYCGSWWHRTGNLLKVDPTAYVPSATLWDLFATAAPAAAPTATSLPPRAQNGYAR